MYITHRQIIYMIYNVYDEGSNLLFYFVGEFITSGNESNFMMLKTNSIVLVQKTKGTHSIYCPESL